MSKKFDKLIKQKIENLKIAPSNTLWEKIEKELDKKDNIKPFIIPFWSFPLFKRTIAASVIFLLGGITTYMFLNKSTSTTHISSIEKNTIETNLNETKYITKEVENKSTNSVANNNKKSNTSNSININLNTKPLLSNNTNFSGKTDLVVNQNNSNNNFVNTNKSSNLIGNYVWVYDKELKAYNVLLKSNIIEKELENKQIAKLSNLEFEKTTSFMSIEDKEESKEEKVEVLEIQDEDDSYKQFKTKVRKLNYQGFWIGPNVGYQSVFIANKHYSGGSFGIDIGYDFGRSIGIQSGIQYSINSRILEKINEEGIMEDYKSEFNGVHIPLMLRYKFTKLTQIYSNPLSFNLIAGLDYSYVNTKNLNQLGLILGTEYDIFTQADLMLTFGIKAGIYNNLNLNKLNIPENINRYNYTLNAYLSVRFIDWVKKH